LRKKESVKVRQPLQKVLIPVLDKNRRADFLFADLNQAGSKRERITVN
jgi:hypothetical protein